MCKSGCHGCPALQCRTGPLAPHDNHSLAEGHRFGPTLASNLLLCCCSAHKSLAPRARTLLGVLGHATLNFVAVATLLFCFFCECPKFFDLAKQQRKMFLGVSEVGKIDFALSFCWLCVFFVIFYILLLRSRDQSMKEVEFAGHGVGHGQRRPMPGKLASLHHWEKPQTISELRSFMGFCNYSSGYVRMYAELSGPLHKMLQVGKFDGRKGSKKKLAWTPEAEDAFSRLKERLLGQLGLFLVDPDKGFVLQTDASDYGVGAVLEQVRDDRSHVERFIVVSALCFASPVACCWCRVPCCLFLEMKSFCLLKYSQSVIAQAKSMQGEENQHQSMEGCSVNSER